MLKCGITGILQFNEVGEILPVRMLHITLDVLVFELLFNLSKQFKSVTETVRSTVCYFMILK